MEDKAKLEGYLINLGLSYESLGENSWLIEDATRGLEGVMVILENPIVIVRVNLMPIPSKDREKFFETVLRLNAEDLIHGAYALDGDHLILLNTLQSATLDLEELQSTLDSISLAVAQHFSVLSKYLKPQEV